mmetsp:Transcript_16025/g.38280  ORF Transcript_16025/g.38280 Transcript_16025/m.38280 type:complete len:83 (+) Transcript_16025:1126-1374(+)
MATPENSMIRGSMVKRATEGILLDGTAMVAISARAATTVSAEAAWSELQHAVGGAACGAKVEDDGMVEMLDACGICFMDGNK